MKKFFVSFLMLSTLVVYPILAVRAEDPSAGATSGDTGTGSVTLNNPLGNNVTPQKLIGRVINAVMGIIGSLALLMFVYGGFTWMTAAGNAAEVKKGKEIFIWATLGLVVIFSSYTLVKFVIEGIKKGS